MSDKGFIILGSTVGFVALMTSFTVVAIGTDDPEVFYRFLGGTFLGNLGTFVVLIISAVVNRKVNQVSTRVASVEQNTNGTLTRLMDRNRELRDQVEGTKKG